MMRMKFPKHNAAGIKNGQYTRITANYSSTLDSGIDVSGVLTVMSRDCQGTDTTNWCCKS
jgi:phage portal protein BeeE